MVELDDMDSSSGLFNVYSTRGVYNKGWPFDGWRRDVGVI